ncbi:cytochrome C [Sphingobacterium faecium]|uniref:cytochrome C n=1 Tax=Sphingobacterium faecium TaxID=34087 RepID=UPI0024696769|nr:cytochrome C [Sphingobacterium faecium]MDH5828784.1 cytochrome C [Sphingobacterium faecium]
MNEKSKIYIFIDDETTAIAEMHAPTAFDLDTRKLVDGQHIMKIVSQDPNGTEGLRIIPFEVRNGPAIDISGIKEGAIIDGIIPIMINAYGKGNQQSFLIEGSETPQSIPWWIWILIISFIGWALYYLIRYLELT